MKPKLIFMKHVLLIALLLCCATIMACGGGEGGGTEKSPEQIAAESSAVTILDTTIKEIADNALGNLGLGNKSMNSAKAVNFVTTCEAGMESQSLCNGGGEAKMTADCTVESEGPYHVVTGNLQFDACGTLPLSGMIDFQMRIGPIATFCALGTPIQITIQNNSDRANQLLAGGDPVYINATIGGTANCNAFEPFISDSRIDICPFICSVSESETRETATCVADTDCDRIADVEDNCPNMYNPSQIDINDENESGMPNGIGDACEFVACGDGICDPSDDECDVSNYCYRDCDKGLCIGQASQPSYCGDGICDPLGGECSEFGFCQSDCPVEENPDNLKKCEPDTWGNGICEKWEDDTYRDVPFGFSVRDCACLMTSATGGCQTDNDCASVPETICRPDTLPPTPDSIGSDDWARYYTQILSTPCACTTCGNGKLDVAEGEQCDNSANAACPAGYACNDNCECISTCAEGIPQCDMTSGDVIDIPVIFTCYQIGYGLDDAGHGCMDGCCSPRRCSLDIDTPIGPQPASCPLVDFLNGGSGNPADFDSACQTLIDPSAICDTDNCCSM